MDHFKLELRTAKKVTRKGGLMKLMSTLLLGKER
jgi:hypothetical protein